MNAALIVGQAPTKSGRGSPLSAERDDGLEEGGGEVMNPKPSFYVCLKQGECGQKMYGLSDLRTCGRDRPWRCPHAKHLADFKKKEKGK